MRQPHFCFSLLVLVYIFNSQSIDQSYVGVTADIADLLCCHNHGRSKSTMKGMPWKLIQTFIVLDRSGAVKLEKKNQITWNSEMA
jgi:putative endonuclease